MHREPSPPALDRPGPLPGRTGTKASGARLLVLLLAFAWGFNWVAGAIALQETPPWSLRFAGLTIGTITLFGAAFLAGYDLRVPRGQRRHIIVASFLNVAIFNIFSAFAQLNGATSRAVIIAYSMPIWSTMLSRAVLGERLDAVRWVAFGLCVTGLGFLVWPQFANGFPIAVFFSLGCALGWAGATVYMKWAKSTVDPLISASWQLLFGWAVIGAGMLIFEHYPRLWPLHTETILAILYIGTLGTGLAHFLWWAIVAKLPAITASIGSLLVPVVGVGGAALLLGERLTIPDMIGFASIFAAAACVLLQPSAKHTEMPE
jgi:drug/metabolite transporter (DMT)-like permease